MRIKALLFILLLLFGLWVFRWEHIATQNISSFPRRLYYWERDRWTGTVMASDYSTWPKVKLSQYVVKKGTLPVKTATNIWYVIAGTDLASLLFFLIRGGKENES